MKTFFSILATTFAAVSAAITVSISNAGDDVDGAILINNDLGRLVGYGDYGMLTSRRSETTKFFENLQANGVNFTRVWLNYVWTQDLSPFRTHKDDKGKTIYHVGDPNDGTYVKVRGSKYENSQSKYDPNPMLYERLQDFVSLANQHGVIVQLCLFDANQLESDNDLRWKRFSFNKENNLAGFLKEPKAFYTNRACRRLCLDIVDRVMAAIGDQPNVIYEIMNEPDVSESRWNRDKQAFHQSVIERLRSNMRNHTGSTVISMNTGSVVSATWAYDNPNIDLLSIHLPADAKSSFNANNAWAQVIPHNLVGNRWVPRPTYQLKPLIVSNDGNASQSVLRGSPSAPRTAVRDTSRADFTENLLANLFGDNNRQYMGMLHFEFLDKDLMKKTTGALTSWNQTTWLTTKYEPKGSNASGPICDTLGLFAFSPRVP